MAAARPPIHMLDPKNLPDDAELDKYFPPINRNKMTQKEIEKLREYRTLFIIKLREMKIKKYW